MTTFQARLLPGDFFFLITKSPPKTVAELLYKAQNYMNVEDVVLTKEMKGKMKRDEGTSSTRDKKKELRSVGQAIGKKKELPDRKPKFTNFTPLIMSIKQILMQIRDDLTLQWPNQLALQYKEKTRLNTIGSTKTTGITPMSVGI